VYDLPASERHLSDNPGCRSLVNYLGVGDLGWVTDAREVPSSHRHLSLSCRAKAGTLYVG
jgi:hypothetical protein